MSIKITEPFEQFRDASGNALEGGYVYIGEVFLNPISNPIEVFWDEELTQPADQPLRTSGGYIVKNGSAANIFTGRVYSILVQDFNNKLIYSSLSPVISPSMSNLPWYNVTNYGDGNYNEETIIAAIDSLGYVNNYTLLLSKGSWVINSNTVVPKNVTLFFEDDAILEIANGINFTYEGNNIIANPAQIISLNGSGTFTITEGVYTLKAEWWGVLGDGVSINTLKLQQAIIAAGTRPLSFGPGTFLTGTVTSTNANLIASSKENTNIILSDTGTETLFNIDNIEVKNITISDNGRSSMDHTANPDVFLFRSKDRIKFENCSFKTDRAILAQTATETDSYVIVKSCTIERVTTALSNENDTTNIFSGNGAEYIHFENVHWRNLVGRSVANFEYNTLTTGLSEPVIAVLENCVIDLFRLTNISNELKAVFFQGYQTKINTNSFVDVFGRHIDILGNNQSSEARGVFNACTVFNNRISYTTTNNSIIGYNNDEAGSIYVRYGDCNVTGNTLDFTNTNFTSNLFDSISVRHGYKKAVVNNNTIIKPLAYGIRSDISDQIDTTDISVSIYDNTIKDATNSSRKPIYISNNSSTKIFDYISIENNDIEYSQSSQAIQITGSTRSSSFIADQIVIRSNYNKSFDSTDNVDFKMFPEKLTATLTDVVVEVYPSGNNGEGVINSLTDALLCISKYNCKKLTISLDSNVTTTQTVTGPVSYIQLAKQVIIEGDNSFAGRIRFYTAGTQQTNVSITLQNNEISFNSCIFNGEDAVSTTALVQLNGTGYCYINTPTVQYGEYFVFTSGPNFSITGGTINDIDRGNATFNAIMGFNSKTLAKGYIKDSTGSSNNRLYYAYTPALIMHQNISLGTTAGTKTFTTIT